MAETHTPGPWWAENLRRRPVVIMGRIGYGVSMPVADHAEQKANARLIAAAPDLLAVCNKAADYFDAHEAHELPAGAVPVFANIVSAIAKAQGG